MSKDQLIPIDIKDVKLLDWLVDRAVVNRLWNEECSELRSLLKEVSEEECPLTDISKDDLTLPIYYHTSTRILETLEASPFGSKNILGQYNHEYTAKWARIVKLFEKDCTFLADCSKSIAQNVKYDVPLFKKQIARATQIKQDSLKKQTECSKNITKYQAKFRERCADIGIVGDHVRSELLALVTEIPSMMVEIGGDMAGLQSALSYYQVFARFLISDPDLEVCPMLSFFLQHGNTTVCQWETGILPAQESDTDSSVEIIEPMEVREKNGCVYITDDLSLEDIATDTDPKNLTPELEGVKEEEEGEVDYGIDTIDFGADIDFGDDVVECGEIDFGEETVEIAVLEDGDGKQTELLLDNSITRNKILDELHELSAFLYGRRDEISRQAESIFSEIPDCPTEVQTTQLIDVEKMLARVSIPLNKLTSDKMRHLLLLKASEKYLDRLTDSLQSQLRLVDKMEDSIDMMKLRVQEAEQTFNEVEPKLKKVVETTKQLKSCVEAELSKRYNGRPVRIMGDINTL